MNQSLLLQKLLRFMPQEELKLLIQFPATQQLRTPVLWGLRMKAGLGKLASLHDFSSPSFPAGVMSFGEYVPQLA